MAEILDIPVMELTCELCRLPNKPLWQIRLSAEECGRTVAHIGWQCSLCKWKFNLTPDDVEILSENVFD